MLPNPTAPAAQSRARPTPFASVEEAWLWTMAALVDRRNGVPLVMLRRPSPAMGVVPPQRPCDPDDVVKCLDRLYRQRRIELVHAVVLRRWGERQQAPDPIRDRGDSRLWLEALGRMEWPLREKGILAPGPFSVVPKMEAFL